ncbi:MAG: 6-carboxytetrahydropterin synthase QueD [Planctomycetota bacterium]
MAEILELTHTFRFEAAHLLPRLPDSHKCRRLHGHSFIVDVVLRGPLDPDLGWLVDFGEVRRLVEPIRDQLDHRYLNEIPGLDNPTSEQIAIWIWARLVPGIPLLAAVTVRETCNNSCTYRGPSTDS